MIELGKWVKKQFPGYYDDFDDATLGLRTIKEHPELYELYKRETAVQPYVPPPQRPSPAARIGVLGDTMRTDAGWFSGWIEHGRTRRAADIGDQKVRVAEGLGTLQTKEHEAETAANKHKNVAEQIRREEEKQRFLHENETTVIDHATQLGVPYEEYKVVVSRRMDALLELEKEFVSLQHKMRLAITYADTKFAEDRRLLDEIQSVYDDIERLSADVSPSARGRLGLLEKRRLRLEARYDERTREADFQADSGSES